MVSIICLKREYLPTQASGRVTYDFGILRMTAIFTCLPSISARCLALSRSDASCSLMLDQYGLWRKAPMTKYCYP